MTVPPVPSAFISIGAPVESISPNASNVVTGPLTSPMLRPETLCVPPVLLVKSTLLASPMVNMPRRFVPPNKPLIVTSPEPPA